MWNCNSKQYYSHIFLCKFAQRDILQTWKIILHSSKFYSLHYIKYRYPLQVNLVIISLTAKRKVFESKRKAHYNEYYAVKLARKLMNAEEDSEPAKEDGSSGRTSPELIFCGIEGCPGHKSGRTERCETAATYRKNMVKGNDD